MWNTCLKALANRQCRNIIPERWEAHTVNPVFTLVLCLGTISWPHHRPWESKSNTVVLLSWGGRDRILGAAGAAETCRVLSRMEEAAQSWGIRRLWGCSPWLLGLHLCRSARLVESGCSNLEWNEGTRDWITQCWKMTFQHNSSGKILLTPKRWTETPCLGSRDHPLLYSECIIGLGPVRR